ncbi:MAG: immunity protein Imm33 domain-containing protein [Saezia sp.]
MMCKVVSRKQMEICKKWSCMIAAPEEMVAVARSTLGEMPIYGHRIILSEEENVSWFFHCGMYSDKEDFYSPVHTSHLSDILPLVIPYLCLPPNTRFIIDGQGYEDVWQE